MTMLTWILGLVISAWVGAMGAGALLRTDSAKKWFGDMLKQSPSVMMANGIGLLIAAGIVLLNLFIPTIVTSFSVKWALFGIIVAQLSTIFMHIRGGVSFASMVGPIVLMILAVIYAFIQVY